MKHVLVETNWVFACCAPRHLRSTDALQLLARAQAGEVVLHLPAICLREAADAIRRKCQPRVPDELGSFLRAARADAQLAPEEAEATFRVLDRYRQAVGRDLRELDDALDLLRGTPGVDAFALSDAMLERAIDLRSEGVGGLKPFDEAILAAVLVRAGALHDSEGGDLVFCTLDRDLQPWDEHPATRQLRRREPLAGTYDTAHLRVRGDFLVD